jgi:hypothetical protein
MEDLCQNAGELGKIKKEGNKAERGNKAGKLKKNSRKRKEGDRWR